MKLITMLPEWLIITCVLMSLIMFVALMTAIIYRLVRYGIKIKAGIVEIDATEEKE